MGTSAASSGTTRVGPGAKLRPHMRLSHLHRCVALTGRLGVKVGCGIYRERPQMCRDFEAGSKDCKKHRRERGIEPHPHPPLRERRGG